MENLGSHSKECVVVHIHSAKLRLYFDGPDDVADRLIGNAPHFLVQHRSGTVNCQLNVD